MSSEEDVNGPDQGLSQDAKKRRVPRACDICRRKKSAFSKCFIDRDV